ncbi:hypothetical protein ANCCAN_15914 [Ancylostoma caninum]|uniref:Uncharacterized protein n=1 Tax=Ancylostoma caninum TaxID=29170 RepID=A0A368G589_ANCCA|nr:hypothetical protein ANCCAN_15914 [Ancylostoma caninum]
MAFNLGGLVLTLLGTVMLLSTKHDAHSIYSYIMVNHVFATVAWSFCLFWSRVFTSNNVSNLFISEWGSATEDIEIEALEEHF